jgi:AhpD family alkylhydroperoxidase
MSTTTETTQARIDWQAFKEIVPEYATATAALAHALRKSGVGAELFELIKIRASQINGCAFCVQYHLNDARKMGIAAQKLDLLAAWREAGSIFTEREAAVLAWTERVTLLAEHHITEQDYAELSAHFTEHEIAFLTTAIAQINFLNRIAAPLRFTPPAPISV